MQLASHELHDLSELIAGCYNTVTCMASFINQAQDPELKGYSKDISPYMSKILI